jgi:hypothetical protein
MSFTNIKIAFKIIRLAIELKSYSNTNSIKSCVCDLGGCCLWCQTGDIPVWQCWFLCLVFRGGTVNWLLGSAAMATSWQMLRGGLSPTALVDLISRRWLKYMYFIVQCCV